MRVGAISLLCVALGLGGCMTLVDLAAELSSAPKPEIANGLVGARPPGERSFEPVDVTAGIERHFPLGSSVADMTRELRRERFAILATDADGLHHAGARWRRHCDESLSIAWRATSDDRIKNLKATQRVVCRPL
jgi:hypothetical protein